MVSFFIGVAQGMPKIEQHTQPSVPFIPYDHIRFHSTAGSKHLLNLLHHTSPAVALIQLPEKGSVCDTAVFDHLSHPVGKGNIRERIQHVRVNQNQLGLPKSTC